jgi:hypothetical protein
VDLGVGVEESSGDLGGGALVAAAPVRARKGKEFAVVGAVESMNSTAPSSGVTRILPGWTSP